MEDGWIVASAVGRLASAGGGNAEVGPRGRILPIDELAIPGQHNVSNTMAAVAVALLFAVNRGVVRADLDVRAGETYRDGTDPAIYVMDADGSHPTRIATNPGADVWPAWQPARAPAAAKPNRG